MSAPELSGEQLTVAVENGILRVSNDPGFSAGNGDGNPYRAVILVRTAIVFGKEVPARTPPGDRWPGFFESRSDLAMWRMALEASPDPYLLRVYAGSFYQGWGDAPGDWIEWSYTDFGKNPTGQVRANDVSFTVPSVQAPPDGFPPVLPAELQTEVDAVEAEQIAAKANYKQWADANPNEFVATQTYLASLANGVDLDPPNLKTHRGRAVSGILQTYAIAKGLAK